MAKLERGGQKGRSAAQKTALMGVLFAVALVLSVLESTLLPPLPMGIKPGLSNVVVMYCLFFLGAGKAVTIAVLKSLFVLLVKNPTTAAISLAGGLCSVLVMCLLLKAGRKKLSYLLVSVCGAVTHNVGQLVVVRFLVRTEKLFVLLPLLTVSGLVVGTLTGLTLAMLLPHLKRISVFEAGEK